MALDYSLVATALSPLTYFDLSTFYGQYASFIDFFVYLVIFLGLARTTLESRFQGRGGQAVIVGVGVALALSLAVTEARIGWNLRSLGPLAGVLIVLLAGMVLFTFVHRLGLGPFASALLTIVVVYLGAIIVTPGLFALLATSFPIIHLLVAVALFTLIVRGALVVIAHIHRPKAGGLFSGTEGEALIAERRDLEPIKPVLDRERVQRASMRKSLADLYGPLSQGDLASTSRAEINVHIEQARDRELLLKQKLDYIATLNRKLRDLDLGLMHSLKAKYDSAPDSLKPRMRKAIDQERLKLFRETTVEQLSTDGRKKLTEYDVALQMTEQAVSRGEAERAKTWLRRAIILDKQLDKILGTLQAVEHRIMVMIPKRIEKMR